MGRVVAPEHVKLFAGILAAREDIFEAAQGELMKRFGPVDSASEIMPFEFTDYYEEEMGSGLLRKFVGFEELMNPEELATAKLFTNELEKDISKRFGSERRLVNLDPGYISPAKLVLASTKDYTHRIYLRDGIFAEVTLYYSNKRFNPWPWTYPDYRTEEYCRFFETLRQGYLQTLKEATL